MAKQAPFWMISPKSLIKLLGAEYDLMQKSGGNVLTRFYISSVLIVAIMIISFLSIRYAVNLLFHISIIEISLSLFLSVLFGFIYILLINTFTKAKIDSEKALFTLSNLVRISFVLFLAFLLSKPIEIYFFKEALNKDVKQYKEKLSNEYERGINGMLTTDVEKLQKRRHGLENEKKKYNAASLQTEIDALAAKINSIENKKKGMIAVVWKKIQSANFFTFRINQLNKKYRISWLICLIVIILFISPGFLIYSISADESYFQLKKTFEKDLIENEYYAFSEKYTFFFQNKYELPLQFYTKYEDPPFNTIPKKDNEHKSSQDFLNKYCPD